jgi:uncharacterized protein (DUF1015 family)
MITLDPIARALVPKDSAAAARLGAPNYDEFQSDLEVWEVLQANPDSILRVTMAHCDVREASEIGQGDSAPALKKAMENMSSLLSNPLTRVVENVLYVYEITTPTRPGIRQIGVGGMARTDEIRTPFTPEGPIIRNEGIREAKAQGRARLIEATNAIVGVVNLAVPDDEGRLIRALEAHADANHPDFETGDEHGNTHRIWLVTSKAESRRFQELLQWESEAYVADGNHRSAAAALLGRRGFLAVLFPATRMHISPYNRLVTDAPHPLEDPHEALSGVFEVDNAPGEGPFQPVETHEIGLYRPDPGWLLLRPRPGVFDPSDPARSIDHDIVQRLLFDDVLGISNPGDSRLTFVGANHDATWLQREVDEGRATLAVTLPPVTMEQFANVCRHGRMMPPKSTWFEPKIRSGLVMSLLEP